MGNKLTGTEVPVNQQDQKLKNYFETQKKLFDSWNGNFKKFITSIRNKYEMHYQKEFPHFHDFIAYLMKDEEQTVKDASAKLTSDHKKIDSLKTEFDKIFQAWIDQKTEEKNIDDEDEARGEWLDYLESQAITAFYSALVHYKEHIEKIYYRQLWGKKLGYARKWMIEDPRVERLIVKYKICEILNELEKKDSRSAKTKKPFRYLFQLDGPKYQSRYPYVCFITNHDFYNAILPELDIKKITVQKYFKALCQVGAIKKLHGPGRVDIRKNETLYAIGYLSGSKDTNHKLNRFLTQKNTKQFLKFKLS
ncbi:MAG: hypothetical protein WBN66_07585 [Smithella sp.]